MHKSIRPEATHVYLLSFWDLAGLFSKVESNFFKFFYHMHLKEMYVFMKIACKTEWKSKLHWLYLAIVRSVFFFFVCFN